MINKRTFVRKPLRVEAVQVTAENFAELAEWCQGVITNSADESVATDVNPNTQFIRIRVHNPLNVRQSRAYIGDWVLYTDRGYKVYRNKAFKSSFDPDEGSMPETAPVEVSPTA